MKTTQKKCSANVTLDKWNDLVCLESIVLGNTEKNAICIELYALVIILEVVFKCPKFFNYRKNLSTTAKNDPCIKCLVLHYVPKI